MACVVAAGLPEGVARDDRDRHPEHPADHADEHRGPGELRVASADPHRDQREQDRREDQTDAACRRRRSPRRRSRTRPGSRRPSRRRRCGGWARCSPADSTVRERSAARPWRCPQRASVRAGASGPHRRATPPARGPPPQPVSPAAVPPPGSGSALIAHLITKYRYTIGILSTNIMKTNSHQAMKRDSVGDRSGLLHPAGNAKRPLRRGRFGGGGNSRASGARGGRAPRSCPPCGGSARSGSPCSCGHGVEVDQRDRAHRLALGGVRPRGVGPGGVGPRRVRPRSIRPGGVRPRGVRPRGVRPRRIRPRGVRPGGVRPRRIRPRGVRPRGVREDRR